MCWIYNVTHNPACGDFHPQNFQKIKISFPCIWLCPKFYVIFYLFFILGIVAPLSETPWIQVLWEHVLTYFWITAMVLISNVCNQKLIWVICRKVNCYNLFATKMLTFTAWAKEMLNYNYRKRKTVHNCFQTVFTHGLCLFNVRSFVTLNAMSSRWCTNAIFCITFVQ